MIFNSTDSWLRDNLLCNNCHSIPRQRALMLMIEKHYPNWRQLSIHESSPGDCSISYKLKRECSRYNPTQYFPDKSFGKVYNGFRNEDLENQTFDDGYFDLVITQDVMEHVYNPEKAFKEIARTLKKGGAHIFTVPLVNKHKKTEVWAIKNDDEKPIFLHGPEYHFNPVNPQGSPVTMHWGFDIVNIIKNYCEMDTIIEYIDDLNYGIRAEYIEVLISFKK